ncbi:MAG TPA: SpoIIE family protein phosphatase [Pirellulaceae bacterium]|jgi:serine phosphatase RsbU (regulator of sigma subunit)|nr:SpoIIE family protein phosphatase [Pirellulaceae bacterium]
MQITARLEALNGPDKGALFDLREGETLLGRDPAQCTIPIDAVAVSRRHAAITRGGNGFVLEDLKSRNGTLLNDGEVTEKVLLKHDDVVDICGRRYRFVSAAPPPTEPETPSNAGLRRANPLLRPASPPTGAVMVDDDASSSTIMKQLDASSSYGGLTASPEQTLQALLEINRALARALALEQVLPQVLRSLFRIFLQADRGLIVIETDDGELVPKWAESRRPGAENETIRISRTVVREVIRGKRAILSADLQNDSKFEMSESIANVKIRSMMCAPLLDSEDKAFGVLQIDTADQRRKFRESDLEVLIAVAAQAGVALDNARLHEEAIRQHALQKDLELAHEVQKGFLPDHAPKIEGFDFYDYYEPATGIGGDCFDYIALPDGRLAVVVADVVGHGIAAALMMAKFSSEVRYRLAAENDPAKAVTRLNDALSALPLDRFITMVMAVVDPVKGELTVVNAGHMAPIIRMPDGQLVEPGEEEAGVPLGIMEEVDYEQVVVPFPPGAVATLYTDGINECMDGAGDFFGIDRIREIARASEPAAGALGGSIVRDVRGFLGEATQNDDMCLVSFGRRT